MLTTRALVLNRIIGPYTRHFTQSACQAGKAPSGLLNVRTLSSELDHRAAREWTAGFTPDDIPKAAYEVTYARSSGPGGQHVNKTSSKAVLRCGLDSALGSWLPRYVLEPLTKTTHYVANPPSLLIASQTSRSASENTSIALALLYKTIITAAKSPIIGETSAEQKEKVKAHAVMENARRRFNKDKRKDTKAARRGEW